MVPEVSALSPRSSHNLGAGNMLAQNLSRSPHPKNPLSSAPIPRPGDRKMCPRIGSKSPEQPAKQLSSNFSTLPNSFRCAIISPSEVLKETIYL